MSEKNKMWSVCSARFQIEKLRSGTCQNSFWPRQISFLLKGKKRKLKAWPAVAILIGANMCQLQQCQGCLLRKRWGLKRPVLMLLADGFGKPGSLFLGQKPLLWHSTFLLSLENLNCVIESCCVACDVYSAVVWFFISKVTWKRSVLVHFLQGLNHHLI